MTPLKSSQYVQISDIDNTADRLAYMLICKYRSQHVDGMSIIKSRLFQALLKYYCAFGVVFLFIFISLVGLHYLPNDFLTIGFLAMTVTAIFTVVGLKRDSRIAVYRCVLGIQRSAYEAIERLRRQSFND